MIAEEGPGPVLRVVGGGVPTEVELAALVVAVAAATQGAEAPSTAASDRRRGGWADRSAGLRRPLRAGVSAWRHYSR
ncbi:MAG: acyl-CoA carboxylase subunit epsilon [Frankiaceae bacterium]|nr:acyl-CoA carboxylase subunit epsilon [Frankiaceae bacterium]